MKNISYLAISIIFIGTVSCRKYRTCECDYTNSVDGVSTGNVTETEISESKMSKKMGETWCNEYDENFTYEDYDDDFNTITVNYKSECELIK